MGDRHRRDGGLPGGYGLGRAGESREGLAPWSSPHSPSAQSLWDASELASRTRGATVRHRSRAPGIASSAPQAWSDGVGKRIKTAMRVIGKDSGPARLAEHYSGIRPRSGFCSTLNARVRLVNHIASARGSLNGYLGKQMKAEPHRPHSELARP
jgi:hypothetical protein